MKFMLAILLLTFIQIPQTYASNEAPVCLPYNGSQIQKDPGDAFPWGSELPFPWRGIQGTWQANIDGCVALISFKTTRTVSGVNQLQVIQYDPTSCQIIAKGVGFEDTRVVRAVMRDQKQQTFNLTVHVFNRSDVRNGNMIAFAAKRVTVMNISTLNNPSVRSSYELEKMSSEANGVCQ